MGYERYTNYDPRGDFPNRQQDYGRDYSTAGQGYSSARDYEAAGYYDRDQQRGHGNRDQGYGRSQAYGGGDRTGRGYENRGYDSRADGSESWRDDEYRGSYGSDGRRFENYGARNQFEQGRDRGGRGDRPDRGNYGRQPQGYDYQDRGFFQRAGDEVRSWFGDDDAERRREADARQDDRYYQQQDRHHRDSDYHSWRSGQIAALDRDYDEYRRENRTKFENEFSSWRSARQGQRDSLSKVSEHMEVLGSDGEHVGTVDKVRGDRILLTKNDADAGGQHHSIPSSWIQSVDSQVKLSKTADEAKKHWQDEDRNSAMFGYDDNRQRDAGRDGQGRMLNNSFTGTY